MANTSVVIPTFNYGRFIADAIESVLGQTLAPTEIIVVDDGSTDDTAAVVRGFGKRVKYIRQENAGVCAARNRGVAESTGELIAFLDADDVWEPTKLEKQVAKFDSDPEIGLVHCGMREFNSDTGETLKMHLTGGVENIVENLLLWDGPVIVGPGGTVMISRKAFESVVGFDPRMKVGEDWDFCYRVARKYKVGFVPEPLVNYRVHAAAAHKNVDEMERGMALFYEKAFATSDERVLKLRRRSLGNYHKVLAGSYWHIGRLGKFARHAFKSIWLRPSNFIHFAGFPIRRLFDKRDIDTQKNRMARSLYICYFGVQQPLVQTQVIPYLLELRKALPPRPSATPPNQGGEPIEVSLLTFEDNVAGLQSDRVAEIKSELKAKGIAWHWLRYHKRPSALATAYDVFRGAWFIRQKIARDEIDILHGRVHIPTLMGAIARRFSRRRPKLLFDIRGFFPEEYTDAGIWPENGLLYRSAKRVERWLMKESDGFVVLTEKAREILFPDAVPQADGGWLTSDTVNPPATAGGTDKSARPVEVIPCCVDFDTRFADDPKTDRQNARKKLGVEDRFVMVHSGALGGLYLTNEIVGLLAASRARRPETFALILTQSDPSEIVGLLRANGFAESDYLVKRISPSEIPEYLNASDVAISFVKSSFSTLSRSPTKIPEYLACGLPFIANSGVGDVDSLINGNGIGALIDGFADVDFRAALDSVDSLGDIGNRCREVAHREFDLSSVGGVRYGRIYSRLLDGVVNT